MEALNETSLGIITTPAIPQIRLGLLGKPGTGKTTAALKFPNPLILDKDRKCPAGVKAVPFYDPAFELKHADKDLARSGVRSAVINWLNRSKIPADYTLILDSYTMWMNDFDRWADKVAPVVFFSKKKNEVDGFAIHNERINMGVEIFHTLKSLPNNFIVNFHEQVERDDKGVPVGIRALIKGQFGDQVGAHVTMLFRTVVIKGQFLWQVKADSEFAPVRPARFNLDNLINEKYMLPEYEELVRRMQ